MHLPAAYVTHDGTSEGPIRDIVHQRRNATMPSHEVDQYFGQPSFYATYFIFVK